MLKIVQTSLFLLLTCTFNKAFAQTSPYKVGGIDALSIPAVGVISYLGLMELNSKPRLDSAYVVTLHPGMVNAFDRGATRNDYNKAGVMSDVVLYTSFFIPAFTFANKAIRQDAPKIIMLYIESMGAMGIIYTWGVSQTRRKRPYVYNAGVDIKKRTGSGALDSFFAGHPAAAAVSSFFAAKVVHDYCPDMKNKWILWTAASIPPALVGYFRYKNGQHFPTDIIAGIPIGVALGILIPEIHKIRDKSSISITPYYFNQTGLLSLTYTF
jgi:membrane-associated phospholipid phosphatase